MRIYILGLFSMLLLGCSTYSKNECQDMDWYVEGKKAALDGFTPKQAKTHYIDKCEENKGVGMNSVEFERGFSSGLSKLCTPEGRKTLESRGIKYQRTCDSYQEELGDKKNRAMDLEEKNRDFEAQITRLKAENERLSAEVESLKSKESSCPAAE